jgi:single-stranded DNA-binding protein
MYVSRIKVVGNLAKDATITKQEGRDKIVLTVIDNDGMEPETFPVVVWVRPGDFDNRAQHFSKGKSVTVNGELIKLPPSLFNGVMSDNDLVQCFGNKSVSLNATGHAAPAAQQPAPQQQAPQQQAPQQAAGNQADDHQTRADAIADKAPDPAPDFDSFDDDIPF